MGKSRFPPKRSIASTTGTNYLKTFCVELGGICLICFFCISGLSKAQRRRFTSSVEGWFDKFKGCRHSTVDLTAPSILPPRFESQAHHLCFYQFIFDLCYVRKSKINKKRPGLSHFLKKSLRHNINGVLNGKNCTWTGNGRSCY